MTQQKRGGGNLPLGSPHYEACKTENKRIRTQLSGTAFPPLRPSSTPSHYKRAPHDSTTLFLIDELSNDRSVRHPTPTDTHSIRSLVEADMPFRNASDSYPVYPGNATNTRENSPPPSSREFF